MGWRFERNCAGIPPFNRVWNFELRGLHLWYQPFKDFNSAMAVIKEYYLILYVNKANQGHEERSVVLNRIAK